MESIAVLSILRLNNDKYFFHLDRPIKVPALPKQDIYAPMGITAFIELKVNLRTQLKDAIDSAVELLQAYYPTADYTNQSAELASLDRLGRLLFELVLPPAIQNALHQLPEQLPLILASNDTELPWELLHNGVEFLALIHPLGRRLLFETLSLPPPQPSPTHNKRAFLLITNPEANLPEADQESENLFEIWESVADEENIELSLLGLGQATRAEVRDAFISGKYNFIHYSGHAVPGALSLADGKLTADQIRRILRSQPFVFLNSCWSVSDMESGLVGADALPYSGLSTMGLASAFIQGGAIGVIGTIWKIFDAGSRLFAENFYRRVLLDGVSVGEALRQTRLSMKEKRPHDPLWASFVLYGDPTLKLAGWNHQHDCQMTSLIIWFTDKLEVLNPLTFAEIVEVQKKITSLISETANWYGGQTSGPLANMFTIEFGVTRFHEDDPERAITTAIETNQKLQTFNQSYSNRFSFYLGISTGQVVNQQSHTAKGVESKVFGPIINLAAELAKQASPGQILIDEATKRLIRNTFGSQAVKTHQQPENNLTILAAYEVLPHQEISLPPAAAPFVGRNDELDQLHTYWHKAVDGRGSIVDISGVAGVGKSRLVVAFQESLLESMITQDYGWLTAKCRSYHQNTPYFLLAQLVRMLAKINADDDHVAQRNKLLNLVQGLAPADDAVIIQEHISLLAQVIELNFEVSTIHNLDPELRQQRLAEVIAVVLSQQSASQPLVLVLEDMHWVDEASLTVLHQIFADVERLAILILLIHRPASHSDEFAQSHGSKPVYRPEEFLQDCVEKWREWPDSYHALRLGDLGKQYSRTLITNLLQVSPISPELIETILDRSGGNPFYVEEMVMALHDSDNFSQVGGVWQLTKDLNEILPHTIKGVIRDRLDRLSKTRRVILEIAAVIGDQFEYQLLKHVSQNTAKEIEANLNELRHQKLIYRAGGWSPNITYAFSHGLIRDTLYEAIKERIRSQHHAQVAKSLQDLCKGNEDRILERLAFHYYHSNNGVKTIDYGLRLANHAAESWANSIAIEWYNRVVEKIKSFAELPTSLTERKQPEEFAIKLLKWHVEGEEGRAEVLSIVGDNHDAIAGYNGALNLMSDHPIFLPAQRAGLYRKIAIVHHNEGRYEEALTSLKQGLDYLGELDEMEGGRIYVWIGLIYWRQGNSAAGLASCERGINIFEKIGAKQPQDNRDLAQAYNLRGLLHEFRGHNALARDNFAQSITLYEQAAYMPGLEKVYGNLGILYQNLGQWDEGLHYYQKSSHLSERTGEKERQAAAAINIAEIYRRQGKFKQAIETNEKAQTLGQKFSFLEWQGLALMNIGAIYLRQKQLSKAESKLNEALSIFQKIESGANLPEVQRYLAELQLEQGHPTAALQQAQVALEGAKQANWPLEMGHIHRVLGQIYGVLEEPSLANTELQTSLTIFKEQNSPYGQGLVLLELALLQQKHRHSSPRPSQAITWCEQAMAIFKQLGAAFDFEQAHQFYELISASD